MPGSWLPRRPHRRARRGRLPSRRRPSSLPCLASLRPVRAGPHVLGAGAHRVAALRRGPGIRRPQRVPRPLLLRLRREGRVRRPPLFGPPLAKPRRGSDGAHRPERRGRTVVGAGVHRVAIVHPRLAHGVARRRLGEGSGAAAPPELPRASSSTSRAFPGRGEAERAPPSPRAPSFFDASDRSRARARRARRWRAADRAARSSPGSSRLERGQELPGVCVRRCSARARRRAPEEQRRGIDVRRGRGLRAASLLRRRGGRRSGGVKAFPSPSWKIFVIPKSASFTSPPTRRGRSTSASRRAPRARAPRRARTRASREPRTPAPSRTGSRRRAGALRALAIRELLQRRSRHVLERQHALLVDRERVLQPNDRWGGERPKQRDLPLQLPKRSCSSRTATAAA